MSNPRSRGWCFTVFGYSDNKFKLHYAAVDFLEGAQYGIMGYEICPETGRPHLQCYIYFENARSFNSVTKHLPKVHFEAAVGTPRQNKRYCQKVKRGKITNVFVEFGSLPTQDKKPPTSDEVGRMIREGSSYDEIFEAFPGYAIAHHRAIKDLIRPPKRECKIIHCIEDNIHKHIPEGYTVCMEPELYDGEDVVLLYAFDKDYIPQHIRYGSRWLIKRGFQLIEITPKILVIYRN